MVLPIAYNSRQPDNVLLQEVIVASELELKMLVRLRAHEILIQNLLWLAFGKDANALRDFAARQYAWLDTSTFLDADPSISQRLPYQTQEALAEVLREVERRVEAERPIANPGNQNS